MRDHRRRRSVLDLGIGDDADRHVALPSDQAGDGLDARIVERITGAVGIDAHRIDRGLVPGGIGAGGIGGVGDDRIRTGGGDECHVGHVVDRQSAEALAFGNALRQQSCADTVRRRHSVADEQDDVLRLARAGVKDVPRDRAAGAAVADLDRVGAGLCKRDWRSNSADWSLPSSRAI